MRLLIFILLFAASAFSQIPAIESGVSEGLAKWRSSQYSNISYKLNLTLEKMSPVLRGSMEIRVTQAAYACAEPNCPPMAIILDWRKIPGHEKESTISNVSLNGVALSISPSLPAGNAQPDAQARTSVRAEHATPGYEESNDHLIFRDGVRMGENVIKLDFTSPILTSGSAITRYVDKEDGAEYIYSLFVPSDASTAFPVFDQPDLKASFYFKLTLPTDWKAVSNQEVFARTSNYDRDEDGVAEARTAYERKFAEAKSRGENPSRDTADLLIDIPPQGYQILHFRLTKPISTYVFAFAAGPFSRFTEDLTFVDHQDPAKRPITGSDTYRVPLLGEPQQKAVGGELAKPTGIESSYSYAFLAGTRRPAPTFVYVRKSQSAKFKPHAAEVFRLNREAVKYLETYFDYKFPFPKYDLVLIPEFPFGGMEHAGATFLREQSVIFPQEPTKNDIISRANLIFHEAAHQWFGDTVTMKWFDDLWLKEGFATFMAYKALDKIMPEANAWKVFYERVKQAAYRTDSTRGTTAIYQPIANLSAAKSAYGNIVYNKAPAFLRQAEFYLGEDKFQTAVRAFLKKHEFGNAGWEDLVKEFETASGQDLKDWTVAWVTRRGLPQIRFSYVVGTKDKGDEIIYEHQSGLVENVLRQQKYQILIFGNEGKRDIWTFQTSATSPTYQRRAYTPPDAKVGSNEVVFAFPNYQDYGHGIFLLDSGSRDYVLKNIGREKDDFLRTMMWGSLWDSVREGELDPKDYVELVIKNIGLEKDESTIQTLLSRVTTAMNYYMSIDAERVRSPRVSKGADASPRAPSLTVGLRTPAVRLQTRLENLLIDKIQNASTQGQRITYYRAFLNIASTDQARDILKQILAASVSSPRVSKGADGDLRAPSLTVGLRTKDKFDIVTRLAILGDSDAAKLLADLEKTETSDDAKRYAYAARAAFASAENKAKFWNDFINNKDISESWIEDAVETFNSIKHSELTLPHLEKALAEIPKLKRERKIFFVNGWLSEFIGGQRDERALGIINKFLADNPNLDTDLRLKILENSDLLERAVKIRAKFPN